MSCFDHTKYRPFSPIKMQSRQWPEQVISKAPQWCSVDLRDGNQALINPMSVAQKLDFFQLLLDIGFKEIEVGFPAASQPDYEFVRRLIEEQRIPDDVTIQVLTQARETLINKTFEALKGAKQAVVHLYNSTSRVQREQVFKLDKQGIVDIAVKGATMVQQCAAQHPTTEWTFQYSPESFTGTELDFAVEVCDAVNAVWQPCEEKPVIINLPATVEMSTANIYADQVEWFCQHVANRQALIISIHTHNDRGCAVAASELALLAGADRIEGTLFGNGERTGNLDIVTLAMNLYSQGIDPELDFSFMDRVISEAKSYTKLPIHPRHPYVGELVYTAFSGSHQDAIKKCLANYQAGDSWDAAYLPIDPTDLNRTYQEVIRVNSQSGKGGVAYILESDYGLVLPRWLQVEFSQTIQNLAEQSGREISPEEIWQQFNQHYLEKELQYSLKEYSVNREGQQDQVLATLVNSTGEMTIQGCSDGALNSLIQALSLQFHLQLDVIDYSEHSLCEGADSQAISYIKLNCAGQYYSGVAIHKDLLAASFNALLCALNDCLLKNTHAAA